VADGSGAGRGGLGFGRELSGRNWEYIRDRGTAKF